MNSLEFIKQHVTEWPSDKWYTTHLCDNGMVLFNDYPKLDLSEHFAPDYYDGKVWTREEFESVGCSPVESFDNVTHNKYEREITDRQGNSATVDVYDVIIAYAVTCPATQHAIKKLLCTGERGHKDTSTDLSEARDSITRAIELLR